MTLRDRILNALLAGSATAAAVSTLACGLVEEELSCPAPVTDAESIPTFEESGMCASVNPGERTVLLCMESEECAPAESLTRQEVNDLLNEVVRRTTWEDADGNTGACGDLGEYYYVSQTFCGPVEVSREGGSCCYAANVETGYAYEGRPFLVEGMARHAELAVRQGWMGEVALEHAALLSADARERIAASWGLDGCHEHASIASFSRFMVQLMWAGAPRELIEATNRAIADEIRHAHDCFSLASAYAGRPLGPLSVEVEGGFDGLHDLEAMVVAAIVEGCVGETLAAAEAEFKIEHAIEPAARCALEGICREEGEHAELSWRFVSWALSEHPELAPAARRAFVEQAAMHADPGTWAVGESPERLVELRHGCLSDALQQRVRQRAYARIVAPASQALFDMTKAA